MKSAVLIGAASAAIPLYKAPELVQVTDAPNEQISWRQCDSSAKFAGIFQFDPESTTYSPDSFKASDTVTFDMAGSVEEALTVKGVHVDVLYGEININSVDHDLEDGTKKYNSDFDLSIDFEMPAAAPQGPYTVYVKGYEDSKAGEYNFCV